MIKVRISMFKLLGVNRIHKLDMSDIKANAEGTAKFFGYLSKSNTIRTFLYDKNPINDAESHKALSSVIGTNITIKSLSLSKINFILSKLI